MITNIQYSLAVLSSSLLEILLHLKLTYTIKSKERKKGGGELVHHFRRQLRAALKSDRVKKEGILTSQLVIEQTKLPQRL